MITPINFELAKLLKEKGFDKECKNFWVETLEHELDIPRSGVEVFPKIEPRILNHKPIEDYHLTHCVAPTIAEVIMWLYEKHGIWITVWTEYNNGNMFSYAVSHKRNIVRHHSTNFDEFNSPTEAYEAGIEYTLNDLL